LFVFDVGWFLALFGIGCWLMLGFCFAVDDGFWQCALLVSLVLGGVGGVFVGVCCGWDGFLLCF
jgi:hypothetical protein